MTAILIGVRPNHSIVLMCISFMDKDVEHYLFAIHTSENCVLSTFSPLLIGLFVLLFHFWSYLYILDMNALFD
jgi:hypothetical protein